MSDLRNDGFNDSAPATMSEEIRRENLDERHVLNDNGGLSSFHQFEEEEEGSNKAKMIGGALVVALLLGAAGIYAYTGSGSAPSQMASAQPKATTVASNAPAPIQTAPIAPPDAAPAPQSDTASSVPAKSPYDAAPVAGTTSKTASTDTDSVKPDVKPVKTARAHVSKTKDEAAQNSAEAEQTAQLNKDSGAADRATRNGSVAVPLSQAPSSVAGNPPAASSNDMAAAAPAAPSDSSATPLPAPPAPPASSMASNGQAVAPQSGTPAQDIPPAPAVTPEQAAPSAPAAPATPAPQADQAAQPQAQPQ
jgi:hypothetical protein